MECLVEAMGVTDQSLSHKEKHLSQEGVTSLAEPACCLEAAGLIHRRVQACICYQGLSGWEAILIFHQCKESGYQVGAQTRVLGHNLPCLGVTQAGLSLEGMGDFMVLFF